MIFSSSWIELYEHVLSGIEIETKYYDGNGLNLLRRELKEWDITLVQMIFPQFNVAINPRNIKNISIIFESGKAITTLSETEYDETGNINPEYFSALNPKRNKSYHFKIADFNTAKTASIATLTALFSSSDLASVTETDYVYDSAYKAKGIPGLPVETRLMNPENPTIALSKTQMIYDNALPASNGNFPYSMLTYGTGNSMDCSNDPMESAVCWENPNGPSGSINMSYRGLPTTTRVWHTEMSSWIETHTRYDQFGNSVAVTDPHGNETTTEFAATYKYAYPTKVIAPAPDPTNTHGTNQTSTSETTYDFTTGLPLSVKDDFGQITKTEYDDSLRPIRAYADNFTAPETQTIYGVPDGNGQLPPNQRFVKVRKQIDATNWDEAITWFDGIGRTIKTQAKDSEGDVFVDTVYDEFGRVERVTSPYRAGDAILWVKTRYDAAGRAVESYAPTELANLGNAQSLGATSFGISNVTNFVGMVVTTTDSSGRKGRSITNALGQLIRVDEPTFIGGTESNDLGTLASPNQPTIYTYDFYGKMVQVEQGIQKRWFKYDSLGRLIRVRQPEQEVNTALNLSDPYNTSGQWTAGFTYDVMGNVLTATDANGVTITNTYDKAGRVKTRSYSDGTTPAVSFYYDGKGLASPQTPNYAKGKLTKVTSSVSETQYQLFDNLGRMTRMAQITDGETYTSKYTYNFAGALIEEEYPSGRKVKNEFEPDGDLLKVSSKKAGGDIFRQYVSNFAYTASGGISQMRLGNGRWETAKFNSRMQVIELGLGNSATDASVWKTNYAYGEIDSNGDVDTTKNTGNIARQTLTVPGTSFVQSYKYDSLHRLTEAVEKTDTTTNWSQQFSYDRYGNRIGIDQAIGLLTLNTTPSIDTNTNRFNHSQGFSYDKNGNVVNDVDPLSSLTRQFIFNGDNKQTEVKKDGITIGRYYYDGEGKRVKKVTDTETTVFVYSSGKLIAEYSTQLSTTPSVAYTTTDHLGTPRIITDELGQIKARRDFMPFGEELYMNIGGRTGDSGLKYSSSEDNVRQKFTGYQKDNETGLDFAEARMYANELGRFTAVDPLLASGKGANPQTFNRYIYVGNNPMFWVDPSGLIWGINENKEVRWFNKKLGKGFSEFTPEHWQYQSGRNTIQLDPNSHRWSYIFSVQITAPYNPIQDFLSGFQRGYNDSINGFRKGAENFAIGALNAQTDAFTGGPFRSAAGFSNPFEIERYSYNSATEAKFGFGTEIGLALGLTRSGGVFSRGGPTVSSVVPQTSPLTTTQRLQMHVTNAANRVDAAGDAAFTDRQFRALANNPNLQPAFRGNRIDVMARDFVRKDPNLSHLQSNYNKGPDFVNKSTGQWWDMTTPNQWQRHVNKFKSTYGSSGTLLRTQ